MSVTTIFKKLKPALEFLLAVCFLNVLLNIRYPASDLPLGTLFKLSPEVLGILLIIWLTAVLRIRFQAAVCVPLTALVIFLRLFRFGDILVPRYFFRPGLIPAQPPPHRGMDNFLFDFLEDFSTPGSQCRQSIKRPDPDDPFYNAGINTFYLFIRGRNRSFGMPGRSAEKAKAGIQHPASSPYSARRMSRALGPQLNSRSNVERLGIKSPHNCG